MVHLSVDKVYIGWCLVFWIKYWCLVFLFGDLETVSFIFWRFIILAPKVGRHITIIKNSLLTCFFSHHHFSRVPICMSNVSPHSLSIVLLATLFLSPHLFYISMGYVAFNVADFLSLCDIVHWRLLMPVGIYCFWTLWPYLSGI